MSVYVRHTSVDRTVRLDDKNNNVMVTLHEDPSNHCEQVKDLVSHSVYYTDAFHAAVKLVR